jgi:ABC-type multidrug transport system fused ATPase/permease subunit
MIAFYRRLWPILNQHTKHRLVIASVLMAAIALLEGIGLLLMIPLLQLLTSAHFSASSTAVEAASDLFGQQGSALAARLAVLVLLVYVVKGFGAIALLRWTTRFAMAQEDELVHELLVLYLGAPLEVHFELNSAEFQRTINQSLRTIFAQAFVTAFSAAGDLLGMLFIALILVVSSPVLSLVGIVYFALVVGVYQRLVNRSIHHASETVHHGQADMFRDVQQALAAVKEIKAGAVEEPFIERIRTSRRTMLNSYRILSLALVQPRYVLELVMVGAAGLVSVFAYSTEPAAAATASIAVFLAGGFRILAPLTKVFNGLNQARAAAPSIDQVANDIASLERPAQEQLAPSEFVGPLVPRIEVRDLTYTYPGSQRPAVSGVDLDVRPGEAVALLGASGAGKSTMVDLLLGLLDPTAGVIRVGGQDLTTVRRAWQRSVAYVPQAISLLDASVRENVVFGWEEEGDAQIWSVLERAQLRPIIEGLPDGVDTRIGERGVRLSGGQRQRLGIARALYRRPLLLVLDEATAALDNETEAQLTQVLEGLRGSLTTVVIAHRLSTVRNVDRVYFFSDGRITGSGGFDELSGRIPEFARLVQLASVGGANGDG